MEICILKFEKARDAEDALEDMIESKIDRLPWLADVGVVSRSLFGRLTIRAQFLEDEKDRFEYKEGELPQRAGDVGILTGLLLGSLAGPLRQSLFAFETAAAAEARAAESERKIFRIDELKDLLERNSSALLLMADTPTCDEMEEAFFKHNPKVIRRDVSKELGRKLRSLVEQARGGESAKVTQAPPPH